MRALRVADRRVVQLADPSTGGSAQPYHAALAAHTRAAAAETTRLVAAIRRFAARSLNTLISEHEAGGRRIVGVGIVVGSVVDPSTITNEHIRAHAEEGRLFRSLIEDAANERALPYDVVPEGAIYAAASTTLGRTQPQLRLQLAALGKVLGGRWRADEKTATLAAWIQLASGQRAS